MGKKRGYSVRKLSIPRMILTDYNDVASTFARVTGLVEIDVTEGIKRIKEIKEKENYPVSMTAWLAKCVAMVVNENKILNSYRKGRKIITFDDVDISIIVEVETRNGKKVPFNYVLRDAVNKSVKELTDEIRAAQQRKIDETEQLSRDNQARYSSLYAIIPRFLRKFVIKRILTNPFKLKKLIGTVGITSLGMFAKNFGGWAIPFADKTLNIAIGAMKEVAIVKDGKPANVKLICLTFLFDHNLVDGAPATRFVSRIADLLGKAAYLHDINEK